MGKTVNIPEQLSGHSLAGHLLIATPAIQESCFTRSVIYLCSHDAQGAMGVIVNYPVANVQLKNIFEQVGIESKAGSGDMPIHFGGPVDVNRGFVLFSGEYKPVEYLSNRDGIYVTADISVLQDMALGHGPKQGMLALGYAGWAAGQLEQEIETGSWIIAPASQALLFDAENETKWNLAISSMGIDLGHLSNEVGHA